MDPESRPNKKIGLALSGGGARGLAHIGVLKTLEEAKIPVDFIAGTSMGAIIGACFAHGMSPAEIEIAAIKYSDIRRLIRMVDMAGGRRGLLAGNHVRTFLSNLIGTDTDFNQLRFPMAICAVDIERGSETVFTQGNVLDAVMASIAVPGIFAPQQVNQRQLVDGGVMNNLPVDHVRSLGADFVIAVDVMRHDFMRLSAGKPGELFAITPAVSFHEVYRYVALMVSEQTRLRLLLDTPDILLQPELPDDLIAFGGFSRATEAIAAGEKSAGLILPEILNDLHLDR
jgi:NTE family protein